MPREILLHQRENNLEYSVGKKIKNEAHGIQHVGRIGIQIRLLHVTCLPPNEISCHFRETIT